MKKALLVILIALFFVAPAVTAENAILSEDSYMNKWDEDFSTDLTCMTFGPDASGIFYQICW